MRFYVFQLILNRLWIRNHPIAGRFWNSEDNFEILNLRKRWKKIVHQATPVTCGNAHICKKKSNAVTKFIPIDRVFLRGGGGGKRTTLGLRGGGALNTPWIRQWSQGRGIRDLTRHVPYRHSARTATVHVKSYSDLHEANRGSQIRLGHA